MKKSIRRKLMIVLIILAALVLTILAVTQISRFHRSSPSAVKTYETDNAFIVGKTLLSAHRSGGGLEPEESLRAFRSCAEDPSLGVELFEFDLHLTKDDVLVLLHDNTLDRTTDAETVFGGKDLLPIDYTYEELRRLNIGAKFTAEDGSMPYADLHGDEVPDDLRILSLDDVLDYLTSVGEYRYIIEIKDGGENGKRGLDILYRTLKERDLLGRVAFGTFRKEVTAYCDTAYPDLIRSTSIQEVLDFYVAALTNSSTYVPPCSVLQIPFCAPYLTWGINLGTAQVVNYAHAHNMAVQYWTINDPKDMEYLLSMGADCIMTDYPDRLAALTGK